MSLRQRATGHLSAWWEWWTATLPGRLVLRSGELKLDVVAAGMAFYALLALFPGLAALVSLYGLIADAGSVQQQIAPLANVMPSDAWSIVSGQVSEVAGRASGSLGLGMIGGLLVTMWSATRGMRAMINALNVVHRVDETRNVVVMQLVAYGLTVLMVAFAVVAIGVVVLVPAVIAALGLADAVSGALRLLPWAALALLAVVSLSVVYKVGPATNRVPWKRVAFSATAVTVLWLIASLAFTVYVGNFDAFNATYGSIGAVVILLFWFFISARIVLFGAVYNALPETEAVEREQEAASP